MKWQFTINWGADNPRTRGAIIGELDQDRSAIGVHAGNFAPYSALSIAKGDLSPMHVADFSNTQPIVDIGPFGQWSDPSKIVTFDPWGHRVAQDFRSDIAFGRKLRPTIAVTNGNLNIAEISQAAGEGKLRCDGKILLHNLDIAVTKISIDPVWYLPGIAARFGIDEMALRTALVEQSGGMYPDLIARPDLKLFLPPIGGTSVYIFGDPARLKQPQPRITCRMHDECNGSDVFGYDLCTRRPYLIQGIEQCIRGAQAGGVGIIVYNRKEGRSLGEVVKYLVYNARKRSARGDREEDYFLRTAKVAGVEDMRLQALSTDVLHWLGVKRISTWVSMSNLKSDAVRAAGIAIDMQQEIFADKVPAKAQVELGAKRTSGYFAEVC